MSAAVLLSSPRYSRNVSAALRNVSCFDGDAVYYTGDRFDLGEHKRLPREERMKVHAAIPWIQLLGRDAVRPIDRIAADLGPVTPVAIELVPGSQLLPHFEHPENALYVFGPEDGNIPHGLRSACHHFVTIPSMHCFNLAVATAIVLYDRMSKRVAAGLEDYPNINGEGRGWDYENELEAIG